MYGAIGQRILWVSSVIAVTTRPITQTISLLLILLPVVASVTSHSRAQVSFIRSYKRVYYELLAQRFDARYRAEVQPHVLMSLLRRWTATSRAARGDARRALAEGREDPPPGR